MPKRKKTGNPAGKLPLSKVGQQIARRSKNPLGVAQLTRQQKRDLVKAAQRAELIAAGAQRSLRDRTTIKKPDYGDDMITDETEIDERTRLTVVVDGVEQEYTLDQLEPDPDQDDDDDGSFTVREPKEPYPYARPGWNANIYATLAKANRQKHGANIAAEVKKVAAPPNALPTGTLWCEAPTCAFASRLIFIAQVTGHEVGSTVAGYKNAGRPPIDHHDPDWVIRCDTIKSLALHGGYDDLQVRGMVVQKFHSPSLRITHKKCNLKRGKS